MSFLQWTISHNDITDYDVFLAQLWENSIMGVEEQGDCISFFSSSDQQKNLQSFLEEWHIATTPSWVADTNWNQKWESDFEPIVIESFCGVRAHFHKPLLQVQHEVIITPRMSFGTGHHSTTQLMLMEMQSINFSGCSVLDFGTGTGILAILAEKLGASNILGIDNDPNCVENAHDNLVQNGAVKTRISASPIEHLKDEKYDVVLANINKNILLQYMPLMSQMVRMDGHLILSGILENDVDEIMQSALSNSLESIRQTDKAEWVLLHFKKI